MPSTRRDCPSCGWGFGKRLPLWITGGGKTRRVSQHMRGRPHGQVTAARVAHALDHWLIRGRVTDERGTVSTVYWSRVPGRQELMRVAVSQDDSTIVTAFLDTSATRYLLRGDRRYFTDRLADMEERHEGDLRQGV